MSAPPRLQAYLAVIAVLAAMVFAVAARLQPEAPSVQDNVPALMLAALAALANLFPLEIAPRRKVSVNTAVLFTAVLILSAPVAMAVAAIAVAVANLGLMARRKRALFDIFF